MSSLNHDSEMTISSFRVFVAVCVMLSQAEPGNAQSDRGDAARGKATFLRVGCYQCHGREAQGASTGPRLGPNPIPLAAFTRAVRTPRNEMPPYSMKLLSDAELADVYAFVSSRPQPVRVSIP
jgi:ubiquinol-cytochrome c reductase cytochrome c subunit